MTDVAARVKTFDRLENADCIRAYANDFMNSRRNLVIILNDADGNVTRDSGVAAGSSIGRINLYDFARENNIGSDYDPYSWVNCSQP